MLPKCHVFIDLTIIFTLVKQNIQRLNVFSTRFAMNIKCNIDWPLAHTILRIKTRRVVLTKNSINFPRSCSSPEDTNGRETHVKYPITEAVTTTTTIIIIIAIITITVIVSRAAYTIRHHARHRIFMNNSPKSLSYPVYQLRYTSFQTIFQKCLRFKFFTIDFFNFRLNRFHTLIYFIYRIIL